MKKLTFLIGLTLVSAIPSLALADQEADQKMLKRIYEMRMRLDRDRIQAENEARSNVRLVTQGGASIARADSPTVTQMRNDMQFHLSQFENNFRCLDVDVENNGGNTVVICGDSTGNITGENTAVGGDIIKIGTNP